MPYNMPRLFSIKSNKLINRKNRMKKFLIFLLCCAMILCFTSCKVMQDLNMVSDKLLISVLYTLENNDVDGYTSLFLPTYLKSNRPEIEKTFNAMRDYYHGSANAYAIQYDLEASSRCTINAISKTQMFSFEPLNTSGASINQTYYVKTDKDEYLILIQWIQNSNKEYGIIGIRILQYGVEISNSKGLE